MCARNESGNVKGSQFHVKRNRLINNMLNQSHTIQTRAVRVFLARDLCTCLASVLIFSSTFATDWAIGERVFLPEGKPFPLRSGELHYPRIPREYWAHRLQMARAMGLNTVSTYMFWNLHEPRPGQFDFSGNADVAEFCRAAQREGLKVILRPGPYVCSEWEMGGLPWWLLKTADTRLRSKDPRFLAATRAYFQELGKHLAPLQASRGGPIILVQVENEYSSWNGQEPGYLVELEKMLRESGFDGPFFATDLAGHVNRRPDTNLFHAVNFGRNPSKGSPEKPPQFAVGTCQRL